MTKKEKIKLLQEQNKFLKIENHKLIEEIATLVMMMCDKDAVRVFGK